MRGKIKRTREDGKVTRIGARFKSGSLDSSQQPSQTYEQVVALGQALKKRVIERQKTNYWHCRITPTEPGSSDPGEEDAS
jgi:hypothetical protein